MSERNEGVLWEWIPPDPPGPTLVDGPADGQVPQDQILVAAPDHDPFPTGVLWSWSPAVEEREPTTRRPPFVLDPELVLPAPALLPAPLLAAPPAPVVESAPAPVRSHRVEVAQRRRRRRLAGAITGAVVVGLCVTVPFVAPQLPDLLSRAVPEPARTPDPTIGPPDQPTASAPSSGTPSAATGLLGQRLKSAGRPLEVDIPRLSVHSEVVPISGNSGELLPPDDPQVLGWWQEGRGAGAAAGSVVVTGHTVHTGGGAFDHLGKLTVGDRIQVRTESGRIEYQVTSSRNLSVAQLAANATEIFDRHNAGRLVLITCSDFDGRVYRSNSVVYATPVRDRPTV